MDHLSDGHRFGARGTRQAKQEINNKILSAMASSSLNPKKKLPPGYCCSLATNTRRRRRNEESSTGNENEEKLFTSYPLLISSDGGRFFLCRMQGPLSVAVDTIICHEESIEIRGSTENGKTSVPEELAPFLQEQWSLREIDTTSCTDHSHRHAVVRETDLDSKGILASITGPLLPLLSISLSFQTGDQNSSAIDPRLLACFKRQLAGTTIAHSRNITTEIKLASPERNQETRTFTVTYIVAQPCQIKSCFYYILPSTRIALIAADEEVFSNSSKMAKANDYSNQQPLSPIAKLLVDTIRCVRQGANVPRSFLLSGPPGVGKTYAVRLASQASIHNTRLVSLRGSELLAKGSSNPSNASRALRREFERAALMMNEDTKKDVVALVFLDECDALLGVDSIAAMFATILDRLNSAKQDEGWGRLIVIAATNRVDSLPAMLRRAGRLDQEIPIAPPNALERATILQSLLEGSSYLDSSKANNGFDPEELRRISEKCVGYVPADLTALVRRAALLTVQADAENITPSYLEQAMGDVGASALRDASLSAPPKITWDDIAGDPGGAKTALRQAIEWPRTKRSAYKSLGLVPPRGVLLHGPPGCAKTTLARAAAGASGVAFLSLSPAEVYASSYVGEAEAVVRRVFTLARSAAPCILFFDEIDSILGGGEDSGSAGHGMNRSGRGNSAEARVLSTFLNEMDGVDGTGDDGVLVLGATNRPWTLDSALLRPGRLGDKIIYVPPPDFAARRSIIQMQCKFWNTSKDDKIDEDYFASDKVTGGMTGAEIVGACREASMRVLRDLDLTQTDHVPIMKTEYLEDSFRSLKPLLSNSDVLQEFRLFEKGRSQT